MNPVDAILLLLGVYLGVGVVFAIAFVLRGVGRIDTAATGAPLGFRLLIIPGSAALWPLLLRRWIAAARACDREPRHD